MIAKVSYRLFILIPRNMAR